MWVKGWEEFGLERVVLAFGANPGKGCKDLELEGAGVGKVWAEFRVGVWVGIRIVKSWSRN